MGSAIRAEGLVKSFGKVRALGGVDFEAEEGKILGLLGPNGAGKTTAVRILTTLLRADSGSGTVGGYDVVSEAGRVRRIIGLTGQYAAVDELLSGRENLAMIGRLLGLGARGARQRADELLEQFDLYEAARLPVKGYSGGMRRRLDLAVSLVGNPLVLFLDEPTTGLDPRSRRHSWDLIRALVRQGTTVLLTTQYLDEADELADRIVVIDHGLVVASGTPDELKEKVGGRVIEVQLRNRFDLDEAMTILCNVTGNQASVDEENDLLIVAASDPDFLTKTVRALDEAGIAVADIGFRRPSLDEVFLALTGRRTEAEPPENEERPRR